MCLSLVPNILSIIYFIVCHVLDVSASYLYSFYHLQDLQRGTKISMSSEDVLCKTGELFALCHLLILAQICWTLQTSIGIMRNKKNYTKKCAATSASTGVQEYVYTLVGDCKLNVFMY
jgi:hypothetical protein